MTLIVYTDIKSPYAYLAKDLIYSLEDELGFEADWRPFTLDIPSYLGSAKVDDTGEVLEATRSEHNWKRVKYAYMDVRRHANLRGITVRGTQKIWDTVLINTALYWAKAQGQAVLRAFLDDVFARFWKRELDVEAMETVISCLADAGADTTGFADWAKGEGRTRHDADRAEAWEIGIFGVPTFRLDTDEIFFGREQLPLVKWRLTGENGPPPIG